MTIHIEDIQRVTLHEPGSRICSLDGCDRPPHAFGYCAMHYTRWKRYGDPKFVLNGNDGLVQTWLADLFASAPTDDCVSWPFAKTDEGYGIFQADKRRHVASRYVCEVTYGLPPTPKHQAAHSCGNGHLGCVNPRHLRWATKAENADDKMDHGTLLRGEQHGSSKLSEADVREIIARRSTGEMCKLIAKDFGITRQHVSALFTGRRWSPERRATADARFKDRKRKATLAGLERAVAAAGEAEAWNEGDEANG